MPMCRFGLLLIFALNSVVSAGELPSAIQAKFAVLLSRLSGNNAKIACSDSKLAAEIKTAGGELDEGSKAAYALSVDEAKKYRAAGKLVICPKVEWLPEGGSIAVVEEGGKPQVYIHMGNVTASGATLSDSILKIGKKI